MQDGTATTRGDRAHWLRSPAGVAALGLSLVAAFYVLREHYAHALGLLPYLLLLACPLLHLLMHRGHGHGHGRRNSGAVPKRGN